MRRPTGPPCPYCGERLYQKGDLSGPAPNHLRRVKTPRGLAHYGCAKGDDFHKCPHLPDLGPPWTEDVAFWSYVVRSITEWADIGDGARKVRRNFPHLFAALEPVGGKWTSGPRLEAWTWEVIEREADAWYKWQSTLTRPMESRYRIAVGHFRSRLQRLLDQKEREYVRDVLEPEGYPVDGKYQYLSPELVASVVGLDDTDDDTRILFRLCGTTLDEYRAVLKHEPDGWEPGPAPTQQEVAAEFGVSQSYVSKLKARTLDAASVPKPKHGPNWTDRNRPDMGLRDTDDGNHARDTTTVRVYQDGELVRTERPEPRRSPKRRRY